MWPCKSWQIAADLETGGVLDGGPVDPDVGEDHDTERAEEGDGRREHQVHSVVRERALQMQEEISNEVQLETVC